MRKIRDPFGNNLLWQTFFRTQTLHRASKVYPKLEKMLVWHKDKEYSNLRGWFNGLFGARKKNVKA